METLFTYLQKRLRGNSRSTYNVKKTFLLTWLGKVWISFFLLLTWFHNFSRFWWCFRQLFIFLIIFFSFLLSINANMVFMKMLFFDFFPWFVTDINSGLELSLNLRQPTESVILGYPASLWDTLVQRGHFPKNPAVQLRYFIKYSLHYLFQYIQTLCQIGILSCQIDIYPKILWIFDFIVLLKWIGV